jgi:mannitol-1-phosphate 5-dehydrogenase
MLVGVQRMADLRSRPEIMRFLRAAFIDESGETLIRKHGGIDPLFTPAGYRDYADDLLDRMVNPFLHDSTDRVGRDPQRKLGWDDRLVGTVREALRVGVTPRRYALGIAAALEFLGAGGRAPAALLEPLWEDSSPDPREKSEVLRLVVGAQSQLGRWRRA